MDRLADSIPYRPYLNRDRLIYITHPDPKVGKGLCDEFIAQGFQVSMVPDTTGLTRLMTLRRPDLVLLPLCDDAGELTRTLEALDAIRAQHLGIHAFLLAPPNVRAEMVVAAMKRGATSVFSPPYAPVELAVAAQDVFRGDIHVEQSKDGPSTVTVRGFGTLTYRERQILQYVVSGRTNKEIAVDLGLSYRTVEVHRRHIMEKIGARNTAELVRLAIES
ncbi:response regulator transcription factor [Devosia sp. ZB163]|uniref:response regulator transcription factor n=1 Tax=Devosia sp. ZB163 TaxID=3025938 RepID=UPI00235FF9E4|nr:response regulator transcription factor [Devosia sp. ZB163]MDC9822957.1 response regulator transcription factor [Devosia sp. ZB163]